MFTPDPKYPFKPGLSLEQARETAQKIQEQYGDQIKAAKAIENRLGCRSSYPGYLGS